MDPFDIFRGFLGVPRHTPRSNFPPPEDDIQRNDQFPPEGPESSQRRVGSSFHVFSSPLEMEGFFSQQMDEMLKQFGFGHFSGPNVFGGAQHGQHFEDEQHEDESGARDFMLRKDSHPGYLRPVQNRDHRRDVEVEQISPDEMSELYSHEQPSIPPRNPHFQDDAGHHGLAKSFNFSQSFSSRTTTLPDGSIEKQSVVRDNEGRETTTVTQSNGEDCLTITSIRHPDGREERREDNSCSELNSFNTTRRQMPRLFDRSKLDSLMDKLF